MISPALIACQRLLNEKPFAPYWGLRGPHQQTLLGAFWPRHYFSAPHNISQALFGLSDGSHVRAECHWQKDPQLHTALLLLHGMEGSSRSGYMLGCADKAYHAGFNALRLNLRNCGGTEHLTPKLYHSGLSQDLREVVGILIQNFSLHAIVLSGFSLGGNICLKLAAEWGNQAPAAVRGMIVVSPLVDLTVTWPLLEQPGNFLYRWSFVYGLKRRLRRKARLFPTLYDPSRLKGIRTVREFDSLYTAPHNGFRDADDYYSRASSAPLLGKIRIPTLAIHALDDPLVPSEPLQRPLARKNPWIHVLLTRYGGHVGYIGRRFDGDLDSHWVENRVVQFARVVTSESPFRNGKPQSQEDEEK
jgi:predicted alpha/beta-fold hydrolase